MERLDVVFLDYQMGNIFDTIRGHAGPVAPGQGGQQLDGLIAELERLLHHRAVDVALLDADQRVFHFIEADNMDLAQLLGITDGAQDGRRIVGPQADQADVRLGEFLSRIAEPWHPRASEGESATDSLGERIWSEAGGDE